MELSSEEWKEGSMFRFGTGNERKGGTLVFVRRRRVFIRLFRVFFPFDFLFFPSDL